MPHVYSTLSANVAYNVYFKLDAKGGDKIGAAEVPKVVRSIVIKGGSGIANKHLITPLGVVTHVTDEELAILREDEVFKTHLKNGFVKFREDEKRVEPEVMAADMTTRDDSAPLTPNDFREDAGVDEVKPMADESLKKVSKLN